MALFKKIDCVECGKQAGPVMRVKLQDGYYLCSSCAKIIPYYAYESFLKTYFLEDFNAFKEYKAYSDKELRPIFKESMSYNSIHVDEEHGLFFIGYKIDKNTVFLRLDYMETFDMAFKPNEVVKGVIGQKVEGDVVVQIEMKVPYFKYEDKLEKNVKAKAKKELFGMKVVYENPKKMEEFYTAVRIRWWEILLSNEPENKSSTDARSTELQQAMALFMLDSLEGVTLNDLRTHRNRLIKAFHPDKGGAAADTRYAQKINNAYEVLKNYIEMNS